MEGFKKRLTKRSYPNPKLPRTNFSSDAAKQINFRSDAAKQTQFPADFIEEIFVRLGVKSLLRFKCVSKQWLFLLSRPQFITTHLKIMKTRQNFVVCSQSPDEPKFGIGTLYNNGDGILLQPLGFPLQPLEIFWGFLGHCNGLLCLCFYSKETDRNSLSVWNPSTKEQKKFPLPEYCGRRLECMAFGYDSVGDDYKVVLLTCTYAAIAKLVHTQILSLNMGSWKTVENHIPYEFWLSGPNFSGKYLNDCIYLIIQNREIVRRIACFDLSTDTVREEESLSEIFSNRYNNARLALCGECLCLVQSHDCVSFDVWRMEEDKVRKIKSWIKLFTLDDKFTTLISMDCIFPVCFTENGKVLIFSAIKKEYALYDMNDGSVQKFDEPGIRIFHSTPVAPYVESLVSPRRRSPEA